ncbi:hypothetical protein PT974_10615 [Cladobotryum mycophilum]|uniref:Uncharacterized protein n=1 Tax=Cladobotryum mycophilum TaxID=491253 RepID=A0ABR0SBB4_9HYPO
MPPPLNQVGIIYQALIQSNCQAFLGNDVDIDIVSQLDSLGTWHVHVLKTEGGKRSAVLSESGSTLQGAFEELHRKSAKAVDQFVSSNGFDLPPDISTRKPSTSRYRHSNRDKGSLNSVLDEDNLEILSISGRRLSSPVSSDSETEADSDSDDYFDRNALGGRRHQKTHHRSHSRTVRQEKRHPQGGMTTHRPVVVHNAPMSSASVSATQSKNTMPAPLLIPVNVPPPPAINGKPASVHNQPGPPWRGPWPASNPPQNFPPLPPPPPGVSRLPNFVQPNIYGPYANDSSHQFYIQSTGARTQPQPPPPAPPRVSLPNHLIKYMQPQPQQQLQQNKASKPPGSSSVMLHIRWYGHGEIVVLEECQLSQRAIQNRAIQILRTRAQDMNDNGLVDSVPSALDNVTAIVKKLRAGEQVYTLGPGFQDDLSALAVEPPQFLKFEIDVIMSHMKQM